jgi:hypothetical protein
MLYSPTFRQEHEALGTVRTPHNLPAPLPWRRGAPEGPRKCLLKFLSAYNAPFWVNAPSSPQRSSTRSARLRPQWHLSPACGVSAPSLPSSLKLDALATDKACEGDAAPSCVLPRGTAVGSPSQRPSPSSPLPRISLARPRGANHSVDAALIRSMHQHTHTTQTQYSANDVDNTPLPTLLRAVCQE